MNEEYQRYRRQIAFAPIGMEGQGRLVNSTVAICGCGALGSNAANLLVRAGVGRVRIIDRDFVDLSNLQRQSLFDEADVEQSLPKAIAAKNRLQKINRQVQVDAIVADIDSSNISEHLDRCDLIFDGTDNFQTRFLINDFALKTGTPWIFAGCLGADGQTMAIVPGQTPCLKCLMPQGPPPAAALPTCETGGILSTIIQSLVSIQVSQGLRILSGDAGGIKPVLTVLDLWNIQFRSVDLKNLLDNPCEVCRGEEFQWLDSKREQKTAVLCGRNSVQVSPEIPMTISLADLSEKLSDLGEVQQNRFLLRFSVDDFVMTLFPDGRCILTGTEDPSVARSVYAKYIGS